MLINVLQNCGKHDIAETLQQENEKFNTEKTKIATGKIRCSIYVYIYIV